MEDLFALLRTESNVPDGQIHLPSSSDIAKENSLFSENIVMNSNGNNIGSSHAANDDLQKDKVHGIRVDLHDVHFKYPGTDREILRGVSISALPGQSIAVVGPSGSGKSTLLRLLVRLFDVSSGSVSLDGINIRNLSTSSLRSAVAVVPQETVLFNDTILHNVAYGEIEVDADEVIAASKAAKLDEAVERMADGWGTLVGERGLKLSGGEKQRVAIARAFLRQAFVFLNCWDFKFLGFFCLFLIGKIGIGFQYRQPRLLICDEATSALDTPTERSIMESLKQLAQDRTSIFVAHRLSTIASCDKIFVMKNGRVFEEGTHNELLRAKGLYHEMWSMQESQDLRGDDDMSGAGATIKGAEHARDSGVHDKNAFKYNFDDADDDKTNGRVEESNDDDIGDIDAQETAAEAAVIRTF